MRKETVFSGVFCLAAIALLATVATSTGPLIAQNPGGEYLVMGCGEFNGPVCKTVETSTCSGKTCTVETTYYYYSTVIE